MTKIRVLHLINTLNLGGAESNLLNLIRAFNKDNYDIHIGYSNGGSFEDEFGRLGVTFFKFSSKISKVKSTETFFIIPRLTRYIKNHGIQIIHTHNYNAHVWGALAAKLAGIKVVEHVHDSRYEEPAYLKERYINPGQFRQVRHFASLSNCIVVLTENNKAFLGKIGIPNDRIRIVTNGIPVDMSLSCDNSSLRSSLHISADARIVLVAARISREKNIGIVLDIAEKISSINKKILFIVAGEGPLRKDLELQVLNRNLRDKVQFIGFYQNIRELLSISEIFIQPTLLELHSIAMLEAMSMGVPVLVSKHVGTNDTFIKDGENGFLLNPLNPNEWAEKIHFLLSDKELCEKIGKCANEYVRTHANINNVAQAFEQIYRHLLMN